jgi:hypothetical protein
MLFFFIFLSCSGNSNVQWCFCSSSCYALAIPMCNGGLTHLIIFMFFQSFKPQKWSCLSFCSTFCISPSPCPPAPQTHKLLDKVSQPSFTLLFSYCASYLLWKFTLWYPNGWTWIYIWNLLKLLTIIVDCNSRIQCLELCLLLVVNMILSYLFNCI